jgi:chemotaxis protein CheZ
MALVETKQLDHIVSLLREKRTGEVTLADMVALVEITAQSLQAFFHTIDASVFRELKAIADYIGNLRQEISALQANDLRRARIPAAGQELDAIVKATESATHSIIECAEAVMAADASDARRYKAFVDERMLVVFEACSFQDITGQRIARVVETLKHIEARVARFAEATRIDDAHGFASEQEAAEAERKVRLLMHGPALAGEGNPQDVIDDMIAPPKSDASQADIDKLFR